MLIQLGLVRVADKFEAAYDELANRHNNVMTWKLCVCGGGERLVGSSLFTLCPGVCINFALIEKLKESAHTKTTNKWSHLPSLL